MIRLNGLIVIDGKEFYLEDFDIEHIDADASEELENFLYDEDDYYEDSLMEEMSYDAFEEYMDDLIELYADLLSEECLCHDCTKELLLDFLADYLDINE